MVTGFTLIGQIQHGIQIVRDAHTHTHMNAVVSTFVIHAETHSVSVGPMVD